MGEGQPDPDRGQGWYSPQEEAQEHGNHRQAAKASAPRRRRRSTAMEHHRAGDRDQWHQVEEPLLDHTTGGRTAMLSTWCRIASTTTKELVSPGTRPHGPSPASTRYVARLDRTAAPCMKKKANGSRMWARKRPAASTWSGGDGYANQPPSRNSRPG